VDIEEILLEDSIPPSTSFGDVLISGATGMLGGYLAESLLIFKEKGNFNVGKIYLAGRQTNNHIAALLIQKSESLNFVELESLPDFLNSTKIETFIHAASPASFGDVAENMLGLFDTNIEMTKMFLDQVSNKDVKFFFFSSGEIYGPTPNFPTSESDFSGFDPSQPRHLYGEFKRAAESLIYIYAQKIEANFVSLRIYHTFGPGLNLDDKRIFGSVLKSLLLGSKFEWKSNGAAKRNFLYTKDLLRAILFTSNLKGFNAFNVAGNSAITISDFVSYARELSSIEIFPHPPDFLVEASTHIQTGDADISKLNGLGWTPTVEAIDAIRRTRRSMGFKE
jgi:UDP-glucuronate decarboxylase